MLKYPDALSSLAELKPLIESSRRESEAIRRMTPEVGAALAQRGFGRLSLPLDAPGHELAPDDLMTVLEQIGGSDAAVALVLFNNCLPALVSRHLGDDARGHVFADPIGMYANSTRPSGRAVPSGDGYTVSGRWTLVTGCQLASWIGLMALEWDQERHAPVKTGAGPRLLMAMLPAADVEIFDTWDAVGVRGSGSHDVAVSGVEVPRELVVDFAAPNQLGGIALGRVPWMSVMAATHGSISIGIARAASAAFVDLMDGKRSTDTAAPVAEHPALQVEFLDADEALRAAGDRLRTSMERIWGHALDATSVPVDATADIFGAARFAANSAKRLTEVVLRWGGTAALYSDGVLEGAWRDVLTINQHVLTGPVMAEQAGRVRLGLEPRIPSFSW